MEEEKETEKNIENIEIQNLKARQQMLQRKTSLSRSQSIQFEIKKKPSYPSLKDFDLRVTLGTGTFGRVKLVYHRANKEFLALKIMKKSEIIKLKQVEHTLNEKNLLAKLHHQNIINLFATYQDRRNLYMLMEYAPGGELFSHLRRAGKFSDKTAKFYTASLVLAFDHMHSQNILFRDLKPENLLLDRKGTLKITDFGFAKEVPERTWTLCGTPEYLAPEIIQSKGHGKPVDWWALGVLIFEMLDGNPPFSDDNPFKIYQKILAGKMVFPKHFDDEVKDLIRKLCTANSTKRLGSRHGAIELKNHPWLKQFDFLALIKGEVTPPIVPSVASDGDTKNFNAYSEDEDASGVEIEKKTDEELFGDF